MKGKLTISLCHSNIDNDFMSVEITDATSGIMFLEARLSREDFIRVLAGHGYMDCDFTLAGLKNVGRLREVKSEIIFVEKGPFEQREEAARQAIAPYEIDGWIGDVRDATNWHCVVHNHAPPEGKEGNHYRVAFHRWVDKEDRQGD